jgi:DNA-binding CsgD family transcriptional regulator/PAS domain-containing protein
MGLQDLSEFVGLIYDTVVDPNACPTMLNRLADLLGASSGVQVGTYNSRTHATRIFASPLDPEDLQSFSEYWATVWRNRKHAVGEVIVPKMSMPHGDRSRTDIFDDWFETRRPEATMGTILSTDNLVSTVMSVSRPYWKGYFDTGEIELFTTLIPHLQRGLQLLRLHLPAGDGPPTSSAQVLNRLPQAVLLVDALARVIFANQTAERMLRAGGGLSLGHDGLRAETHGETRRLRQIIGECAGPGEEFGGSGGRLRLSREHRAPLTVLVVPHRTRVNWIDFLRPTVILFVTDPEATVVRSEWLRQDFGLTPAEAGFTREMLKADGLQAAADRLDISLTTARTHLAHVFDKTGTRRQAELAA